MLFQTAYSSASGFQSSTRDYTATAYYGQLVTASGTANAKGSWTDLTASTYTPHDVFGFSVKVSESFTSGQTRPTVMDIGVDPAGGTSYTPVINDICVGGGTIGYLGGIQYYFPMYIKAGSQVGLRIASATASHTARVVVHFLERPSSPLGSWCGQYSETIGFTSNSLGTTVTLGAQTKGSWTSLGTTSRNLKYWQVGVHANTASLFTQTIYTDLAYGDGTNFKTILSNMPTGVTTAPAFSSTLMPAEMCFCDVPAGSTIYARAASSNSSVASNFHVTAIGIGG